ncbi:MAG: TonB-dependent receptor [Verrucomicrobia bacterium]|nr:TonB-dependent receptor [Verrucomicrobiota bacterium]
MTYKTFGAHLLALLPLAFAQAATHTASTSLRLGERVVTATRSEKTAFDTPATVQTVTAADIQLREQARTLPEALSETPGIMVQKTAHGQGSPFIRGFTGFRTLLMVDGIRVNNSAFRDGPNQYWNTVDPLGIERLEVVKGGGAVLYGSDAVGGTVNAITRSRDRYGEGFLWDREAYYRISSAEDSHIGRAQISGSLDREFGFILGVSLKSFGDLRAGHETDVQRKTGYDEWDGDFKAEYFFAPETRLVLAHQRVSQDNIWRTHRTLYGDSFHGTTVGDDRKLIYDQDRELTYLQFHSTHQDCAVEAIHASVSFQEQTEDLLRVRSSGARENQGFEVGTFGASFQLESPSPFGRWIYGADYYHDDVDSYGRTYNAAGVLTSTAIQGPVADNATYDLVGFFVQDDIPLGDRFNLILAARYTHAAADADAVRDPRTGLRTSISNSWDSGVGSGRLLFRADDEDHWHLFTSASQSFRAPNLSDLTRFDIARSGEIETAAPGLKPEEFISYEFGVKAQYRHVSAQAAYFYTDIADMIVRAPTGNMIGANREVTKKNAGNGYLHGIELSASYQFHPQWTASGWFTWMEGEVDQYPTSAAVKRREPISRLMPVTGQFSLRWEHPSRRFWIEGVATVADRQDNLSTEDTRDTQRIPPDGTPGYAVGTLRAGWNITRDISVTAAVENLSDEDYRIHGSGLNEPGRNIVATFRARF